MFFDEGFHWSAVFFQKLDGGDLQKYMPEEVGRASGKQRAAVPTEAIQKAIKGAKHLP